MTILILIFSLLKITKFMTIGDSFLLGGHEQCHHRVLTTHAKTSHSNCCYVVTMEHRSISVTNGSGSCSKSIPLPNQQKFMKQRLNSLQKYCVVGKYTRGLKSSFMALEVTHMAATFLCSTAGQRIAARPQLTVLCA